MRYLCLPVDICDDPRTLTLRAALGTDHAEMYLIRLFCWTVRQSPDGMIGIYDDLVLEAAAGWVGERGALMPAIRASGWIVGDTVADWNTLYRVEADRDRIKQRVAKHRAAKRHPMPKAAGNVTVTEFPLSLNCNSNSEGEVLVPTLSDPWWETDPATMRAWLLSIPGPHALLALPDRDNPAQSALKRLQDRYPAWDGVDGRPTVQNRADATWDALCARARRRTSDPYRAIAAWEQWIGDRHDEVIRRMRRASGADDPRALFVKI